MKRLLSLALPLLVAALAVGCAHPISLSPDAGKLMGKAAMPKMDRKVALVMTDEQKKIEVQTPGGGGDKLSYFPYRDLEAGLYVALSESFASVSRVGALTDPKVKADAASLLFVPDVVTSSSSPSLLTWPPTVFTITLGIDIKDTNNVTVKKLQVQGEGRAEYDEFKSDTSLTAKRAADDVLMKLMKAIAEVRESLK
jgi:hypothetical protein